MDGRHRIAVGALAAALAAGVLAPVTARAAPGDHHGGPSAHAVAAGKARVAHREQQVRAAAARLARSRRDLAALADRAEIAIEAFNRARLDERSARRDVRSAELVVQTAAERVAASQEQVGHFAAAAYMSGGFAPITAMVDAAGPQTMLDRVSTIQAIASAQRDATQSLEAARVYELTLEQQARTVLERARRLAADADAARDRAQAAVDRQTSVLDRLRERRHRLTTLLARAQHHASALERARLAAIARARAEAAARARARAAAQAAAQAAAAAPAPAPAPAAGTGGTETGNTVAADLQQRAVDLARAQIGKPYRWGAAGPDSFDCSGLVMWAYAQVGVSLDHWTGYQWQEGAHIPVSALRPGDLLFFASDTSDPDTIHHVGIYVGGGQMVEAPYTGADVRLNSAWRPDLIGTVRPYDR